MIRRQAKYLSINDIGKSIDFHAPCHPACSAYGPLEKLESLDSRRMAVTVWGEWFIIPLDLEVEITGKWPSS